jgi:RNA polymerase sigma-70 factor (ECF subfamily)
VEEKQSLIASAQQGDADAFLALVRIYERRVYLLARGYCGNHADAEDLSQEVWLKVYRSIRSFREEANFLTWVRHILVNSFLNWKRSRRPECALENEAWERAAVEDHDSHILYGHVAQVLQGFPRQQRMIVLLTYQEEMTHQEVARFLRCSPGTVKKALFRSIGKLREYFETAGKEPAR